MGLDVVVAKLADLDWSWLEFAPKHTIRQQEGRYARSNSPDNRRDMA
jgi:hypothetical protein